MFRFASWILFVALFAGVSKSKVVVAQSIDSATWPQFRGADGQNRSTGQVPIQFGPGQNELWRLEIPHGNSSPVVWKDHIFLTGADESNLFVLCIARETGDVLWKREFKIDFERDYFHTDSSAASPTCCTDGERVYSYFGNYGVVVHDFEGNAIWKQRFPTIGLPFGVGSSPILHDGKLYVVRDVPQYGAIYCYDARSGNEVWMTPRPHKQGSYSSPVVWESNGEWQLVIGGSGTLDGYNCDTGKGVWTVNNLPAIACTSPAVTDEQIVYGAWTTAHSAGAERTNSAFDEDLKLTEEEIKSGAAFIKRFDANDDRKLSRDELPASRIKGAFRFMDANNDGHLQPKELDNFNRAPTAPGRNVMVAIRPGGSGDVTDSHVIWESTKQLPYVASPLIHDDRVYYVKKGGFLTRLDLATGKEAYTRRLGLGGEYYATPMIVNDHVYVCAARGTVFVIEPNDKLKTVAKNEIGEEIAASPAVIGDTLYLRTAKHLYAFGTR